jgi:hypothetical protein
VKVVCRYESCVTELIEALAHTYSSKISLSDRIHFRQGMMPKLNQLHAQIVGELVDLG